MAITIISNFTSGAYYASSNPINITVASNNSGNCNFRYICDIYISGTKVFTQKLFPDPISSYGFFQINRVLQDYIQTTLLKAPVSNYFNLASNSSAPSALLQVQCKFGEEYDSSSTCDGVVNQYLNLKDSNTIYAFEGAISYEDWPSFDYTKYTFATTSNTAKFLTNSPREVEVTYNDSYFLDFISTAQLSSSRIVALETYDWNNQVINAYLLPATSLADNKRYRIAVGPYDLNKIQNSPIINQSVKYYKLNISHYVPFTVTPLTEMFTFYVTPPKTYQTRIGFVGLLGGLEHFTFYHRNVARYELQRKSYERGLLRNYSNKLNYQVGDRGTTQYSMRATEKHTVSSFCSREVSEWLNEMWLSPEVWTYKRPELMPFQTSKSGGKILLWINDHGLKASDQIFIFPDVTDGNNSALQILATVTTVINENQIDCNLLTSTYPNVTLPCGWVQKKENWQVLPIVISDNQIEIKQKTTRPIEYTLNYDMAYMKNTLR